MSIRQIINFTQHQTSIFKGLSWNQADPHRSKTHLHARSSFSRDKSLFALKSNKIACDSNIIPRHNQPIRIITFPINDRKRGKIRILCADDNNGFRNYNLFALWFWISVCGREVSEGKHNKKWGDYEASSRGCSCQNQIIVTCKFALAFHPPSSDVFLAVNRAGRVHQQHIQQAIITWQ